MEIRPSSRLIMYRLAQNKALETYKYLLEDLRNNDSKSFRNVLELHGLPKDENWYDYDLLIRAIRMHRKRFVMHLLNKRCRVNKPERLNDDNTTPLHMVAEKLGWCDVIEKMLQLKARVTDQNADGNTLLHVAFLSRQTDRSVQLLLEHHVKQYPADIVNNDGLGFMHIACIKSDYKSVKKFFDVGFSDIYSQVSLVCDSIYAGYSPLHFAVEAGKYEMVNFLCQYDADVYAQDRNGSTPLHLALRKRDTAMIDILCYYDSVNENYVDKFGISHFMVACAGSDANVVEQYFLDDESKSDKFLNARVLKDSNDNDGTDYVLKGFTPLHFAALFGHYETANYLLVNGAKCCTPSYPMITPAQLAAENGHEDVADLIGDQCEFFCKVDRLVSNMSREIASEIAKIVLTN